MAAVASFAWGVLAYTVGVVLWGAYVRATGSGAGCGAHWPLCNGEILPRSAEAATLVEFSHRLTSGVALLAVLALLVWTFRICGAGHPARRGAVLSVFFMVTEAAVGAGLVLFQLVADNATMARAMFMAVHLLNTFLLLGAISLTAWWLSGGAPVTLRGRGPAVAAVAAACAGLLLAGASGAVAALGDTLFPSASLAEALRADLSASSHVLIRLRVFHPVLAVAAAFGVVLVAGRLARGGRGFAAGAARVIVVATAAQVGLGFLNVALLAPLWLQIAHLFVADAIWILFVLLSADALGRRVPLATGHSVRAA